MAVKEVGGGGGRVGGGAVLNGMSHQGGIAETD